jgi:hypothetical protein
MHVVEITGGQNFGEGQLSDGGPRDFVMRLIELLEQRLERESLIAGWLVVLHVIHCLPQAR